MKKFLPYLIIISLLWGICCPLTALADETENQSETTVPETEAAAVLLPTDKVSTDDILLYSSACCVMDADSGEILYYKNMDDRHYPASITKVLTGLLLIENASLTDTITFTQDCWDGLNFYEDMNIGILDGEQLTVEAALHAILLSSANEVCNGAAKYVSGTVSEFCNMMNERVTALGCTNTNFVNPNGLQNENHYTSAHDMALIARAAIQNPTFRKITGAYEYTVEATNLRPEGFVLGHKHQMLMYTQYHYDACIGGKTGYTESAKNTLVTYAEKNGMTLVCVVMENSDGHIYPDTIKALDYCFDNYQKTSISTDNLLVHTLAAQGLSLPFTGFDIETFNCVSDNSSSVVLSNDTSTESLSKDFTISGNNVNISPYQTALYSLGTINYTLPEDGQLTGTQLLYTSLASLSKDTVDKLYTTTDTNMASNANMPTFIQFQAPDTNTAAEPTVSQYLIAAAMKHLPATAFALVIGFVLMTFLLIWLRGVIVRSHHRRKYERLRRERIKNRLKNQ